MHMLLKRRDGRELNAIDRDALITILADFIRERFQRSPGDAGALTVAILNHSGSGPM